jgi:hypothetical protein
MTDSEVNNRSISGGGDVNGRSGGMEAGMDKFARSFEASARRWELVVYPSLLAFIVLAAYGFFLIYTLTTDVGRLARSIETMVVSMNDVAHDLRAVSENVGQISSTMVLVANDVGSGTEAMKEMLVKIDNVNKSMGTMTTPIYHMRDDMSRMNRNMHEVAGPMKTMGGMFPF